jgi:ribA/ribD-fused uncharacterized protein
MMPIDSFSGQYRFLSNFWPSPVMLDGEIYPTVEHAFQAAKTRDPGMRNVIRMASSPGLAKRLGRSVRLRDDWETIKVPIMSDLVWLKFQDRILRQALIGTNPAQLIEGNSWNDTFWGVCNGVGQNHLGRILMNIREHLIRSE